MSQTDIYAQAIVHEAQKEGADAKVIVERLVAHLKSDGREKLLPGILRSMKKIDAQNAKLAPMVEVAHEKDAPAALAAAAALGIHAEKAHVQHDLISGWRARGDGKLVDHSAKRALIDLYRNVTS